MRVLGPILVGIALLGCKDPPAKPADKQASPTAGPTIAAPAAPHLDEAAETDADKDWATNTERVIKAAAPELTEVECKDHSCRAVLVSANESELMKQADRLSEPDSLRGTDAHSVLLSAPAKLADGRMSMPITIRYER